MNPRFALTGVAGFVAPRHIEAIKSVKGDLVAALDPRDSVGVLDKHFPLTDFQTDPERFWRLIETKRPVDFVSITAPNHVHADQVHRAARAGIPVICEKPLAITHWDLDDLLKVESRVIPVLQLRYAPEVEAIRRQSVSAGQRERVVAIYHTPRGTWYERSWKGDTAKSGGLAVNIGVHLFDMLIHCFGAVEQRPVVFENNGHQLAGKVELTRAEVYFSLSINPWETPRRELHFGERCIGLSFGADLHKRVYEEAVAGRGLQVGDAEAGLRLAIDLAHARGVGYGMAGEIFEAAIRRGT